MGGITESTMGSIMESMERNSFYFLRCRDVVCNVGENKPGRKGIANAENYGVGIMFFLVLKTVRIYLCDFDEHKWLAVLKQL